MGLLSLVVALVVAGIALYFVDRAPFIDPPMKTIIKWIVYGVVLLWLVTIFFGDIPIPRWHR